MVVDVVVVGVNVDAVVVVVAVPTQDVVRATHMSSMVSGLLSSHCAPAQNALALHELRPGDPGKQFVGGTVVVVAMEVVDTIVAAGVVVTCVPVHALV